MKYFFVIQMVLVVNFLFHLNIILVTGQVAFSRRWLRGKFSDRKTEMNLMKIPGSRNGMQSDFVSNGNGAVNSDGNGYGQQVSSLRQPPLKRMKEKMLKRLLGQDFKDVLDEGNNILVTARDADNSGQNQDGGDSYLHIKTKAPYLYLYKRFLTI